MVGELDVLAVNTWARNVVAQRLYGMPREDLEDTVGNTWVSLLGCLGKSDFRGECSIVSLVYRIAYRRSVDRLRKMIKERERMTEMPLHVRDTGATPAKLAEDRQMLGLVIAEFAAMSEEMRMIANMYFFDDYSVPEISLHLGIKATDVRYKIDRALHSLRACFDDKIRALERKRKDDKRRRLIGWVNRFYRAYALTADENGLLVSGIPSDARQAREDIIDTLKGDR